MTNARWDDAPASTAQAAPAAANTPSLSVFASMQASPAWADHFEILGASPFLTEFARALGGTPMIEMPSPNRRVTILAKCEWHNPCASIKDRVALILLLDYLLAVQRNERQPGVILEYSGGNLAHSLAYLCRGLGLPLHLVLSDGTPPAVCEKLRGPGVELTLVAKQRGFLAVIREAEQLAAARTEHRFLYQHENDLNWKFHALTTGREILAQHPDTIDRWIASVGTGGTFAGVLKALLTAHPHMAACAVTPVELPYGSVAAPNGLPKYAGSGGLGWGIRQRFVSECSSASITYPTVSYQAALQTAAQVYRETGMRIGSSAAANYSIACQEAARMTAGAIVTVLPCQGTDAEWQTVRQLARKLNG